MPLCSSQIVSYQLVPNNLTLGDLDKDSSRDVCG